MLTHANHTHPCLLPPRHHLSLRCILRVHFRCHIVSSALATAPREKIGDNLPHLPTLKPFFPYFWSMNTAVARCNRFSDHEGTTHYIS